MSIQVALRHVTQYTYDRIVNLSPQIVRLRPAPHCRARILSYSLNVEPGNHFINWQQDPFANHLARLVFPEPVQTFKVIVDLIVEMSVYNPFDFFLEEAAETFPFEYDANTRKQLQPYLDACPLTPALSAFLADIDRSGVHTIDFLVRLNQRLPRDINYLVRMEPGVQTAEQTLSLRSGSCRDSAWLLVQVLRHLGLAARFVSGYLIQLVADVKAANGPSGPGADFTDLHAWCEVYLPGAGWVGLDPTSGMLAGEGHIPVACAPEPGSAAPMSGAVDSCQVGFRHEMEVVRILDSARVSKPYSEAQWQAILQLGRDVDASLVAGDVRLAMGSQPTFVADGDQGAPEWNFAVLGPSKRGLAIDLAHKLLARYGNGGFLHSGRGAGYHNESPSPWSLSVVWRDDGQPCWQDPDLLADERQPSNCTNADAERFIRHLANRLGAGDAHVRPGFEDEGYYQWRQSRLPLGIDFPGVAPREDFELERLRRVFDRGLTAVVGYALPLHRVSGQVAGPGTSGWVSGHWNFRRGHMYLIPGDLPMGCRLPLDSLPGVPNDDASRSMAPAPTPTALLPTAEISRARVAVCVEVRNGVLNVFMPPLSGGDDYLDLLAGVEATAAALGVRVAIEGFPPPDDSRFNLRQLRLLPGPGVVKVKLPPASAAWDELVENTEFLYRAAHASGLTTEKFMLDGRHAGSGGGNHVILGGSVAGDSPFLRKPGLLASLIAYWHNHPSLSYLFSGLSIGPASEAPRVDEACQGQLHELEIALAEIRRCRGKLDADALPWPFERTLCNALFNLLANTRDSEFRIDAPCSPTGAIGFLGGLQLRSFEMPPHARMSIVQQLLLRALVARFWKQPYEAKLTRWGAQLHDRFLLPTFVMMDFDNVITELNQSGYTFALDWFAPHCEFRFPRLGEFAVQGMQMTLRHALEPLRVAGGTPTSAGQTARDADFSVERMELRVTGLNDARYAVTVNGRALPLQPTGQAGEFVAGVRYRAWPAPFVPYPSGGVHAPLTFDVVDTWMNRSLGGCQYHVTHPGGRNDEALPVNSSEAESRRLARFLPMGHTSGFMTVDRVVPCQDYPFTLDLRC